MSITEKSFYWRVHNNPSGKFVVERVYLWELGLRSSKVLVGNHKNLNPHHTIDEKDDAQFERDPTDEEIAAYVAGYEKEPVNPETGRPSSVWFEEVPTEELLILDGFMGIVKCLAGRTR